MDRRGSSGPQAGAAAIRNRTVTAGGDGSRGDSSYRCTLKRDTGVNLISFGIPCWVYRFGRAWMGVEERALAREELGT